MDPGDRLALYTTIYPGGEKYLPSWYESVVKQTDSHFDVWIGLHGIDSREVIGMMGGDLGAVYIEADSSKTPAQVRQRALARIVERYSAVVFVDSDDLLYPSRIEAARKGLRDFDVYGCALHLIDEDGHDLCVNFKPPDGTVFGKLLLRNNVFGMSNTAYRSSLLKKCLPIPVNCVLVDWYIATRCMIAGASFEFDRNPGMKYRQHQENIARVMPPFSETQVLSATEIVLNHYECLFSNVQSIPEEIKAELEEARSYVGSFYETISNNKDVLRNYVTALNKTTGAHIWWDFVADPHLESIWKKDD